MTVSKRLQVQVRSPAIFQPAPTLLAVVGFVGTWGGIPGKELNWGGTPGRSDGNAPLSQLVSPVSQVWLQTDGRILQPWLLS